MNIDTTITIDTLLNTGLALLGWLYIMSRTWRWLGSIFLKQWKKRRKQELRQKALEAFYDAFELSRIEPGTTARIATKRRPDDSDVPTGESRERGISMKFSKFSELVNRILSNNHSHRRDMDVTIVVHSPGSIGSTPSVEVQSIHAGFDWDSGKVLIFPSQPLTTLTPEQITDITDSVRKGQSWHAYQEYKKHQEQLEKLSIELDALCGEKRNQTGR